MITPAAGYQIDPNNPNGVIPIPGYNTNSATGTQPTTTPATPAPTQTPTPTTPPPINTPATTPTAPAPATTNAGRYAVTLSSGQTVYYDSSGQAYNEQGATVSNGFNTPSTIGSVITPPTQSGTPNLPQGQAAGAAATYVGSIASTLSTQTAQLQAALQQQQQQMQSKIDALTQKKNDLNALAEQGLMTESSLAHDEAAQQDAALQQEQQQFQQMYDAKTQIIGQMTTLAATGQQLIEQVRGTTGLSSILSPRLTQTMADVTGQMGLYTSVLSAMDGQIGAAQNQVKTATATLSTIYGDQMNYWKTVVDFYSSKADQTNTQIASLTKDQQSYVDAQIKIISDQLDATQATAQIVQKAMLDPTTALAYAKAGVSLNDTPAQINQKLGVYEQAVQGAWGTPYKLGNDFVQKNSVSGEVRNVASATAPQTATQTEQAAVGTDLADAKTFLTANPDKVDQARQVFLAHHPGASAEWDAYFANGTPQAPSKGGILGFFGL